MSEWHNRFLDHFSFHSSDNTRFVQMANPLSIIPVVYGIITGIALWFYDSISPLLIATYFIFTISILTISFFLQYRGNIQISKILLVSSQWVSLIFVIIFIFEGYFYHSIDSYLLAILYAGVFLGGKAALIITIINLIPVIIFSQYFPNSFTTLFVPQPSNIIHLFNMLVITTLVVFADRYIRKTYQTVEEKDKELRKTSTDLKEIRLNMEQHVEERSKEIINQKLYYEALVKNSPLAIVTLDLNHQVIACNPAFENMFGYPENEVVGTNLDDLITTSTVQAEAQFYTQRALNGESVYATGKRRTKSGKLIDVEIHGVPVLVDDEMIGIYALYNDISHRVQAEEALREREERHRIFFENVPVSLWEEDFSEIKKYIDNLYREGITDIKSYFYNNPDAVAKCAQLAKIINTNRATLSLYSANSKDELIGSLDLVLGEQAYEAFRDEILSLIEGNTSFSIELMNRTLTGQIITVRLELSLAPGYEDTWSKVFVSTTNITEQKKAQNELEDSEARQRLILETMPVLMFAMNENNIITTWNRECEITTGYQSEEIINNPNAIEILFPDTGYRKYVLYELQRKGNEFHDLELEFFVKSGKKKVISWSNISSQIPIPGWNFWAIGIDVTERKAAEEKLKYLASHDTLTDLPNRALFNDRLNHALSLAKRNNQRIAVMFLDLDNFKMVNDTLGHEKGDELLIEVARRIVKCIRESDTVARIGGDEFTFVLENITSTEDVVQVVDKISNAISSSIVIGGHAWNITPSIGITLYPEDGLDAETLLKNADIAMYTVKGKGKNGYFFFQEG